MYNMKVEKRNGSLEDVSFDKILNRIKLLCDSDEFSKKLSIDPTIITQKVCSELYDGVTTTELDILSSEVSISLYSEHLDYAELASRIIISNHHKKIGQETFSDVIEKLYENNVIEKYLFDLVQLHKIQINQKIEYSRDYKLDFFGFKTLEKSYLLKCNGSIVERPQDLFMRVSLCIHRNNIEKAFETYNYISNKYFIHATPTLFNAGTCREQLASCFLLAMKDDSIVGIYDTLKDCAKISKYAGGIGLHLHNIRADGSYIAGTNGTSNGLVPMLRVFNDTARYVDQCITPETYIYTTEGPKQISSCEINNTEIFTLNGVEKIENVLEHPYDGVLKKVYTVHSLEPLQITPEHPVYCLKNQKTSVNYSVILNRLKKGIIKPEWIESKELTTEDLLIFTRPKYELDNELLSEEDCYMYGLILGDGCMNHESTNCYISINKHSKKNILDFSKKYLTEKCIEHYTKEENNTVRIYWKRNIQLPFRYNDIYDTNKEKYVHKKWLNLPLSKSKYIIKGLIDTDGCKNKELLFDSTSRNLIESLRYLLLKMNILSSGYIRDRIGESHISKYGDRIENKKISYTLRIPKTKELSELLEIEHGKFFKFFTYNDMIFTRINKIEDDYYNGVLYDLQMNKTHNYMIHNGVIHNGGGKRNGSFAMYLEPWHADVFEFIELKKNHGNELERARDLFYALWIPDLFMKRVKEDGMWTLMCPHKCPGLSDCYGEEFNELYIKYESENKGNRIVRARELWNAILTTQIETGTPYLLYKDQCNSKSNQKNLGTIKSSNLCTEIIEYSDKDETAVCNLASISLPSCLDRKEFKEKFIIYSKDNCKFCEYAKKIISNMNVEYEIVLLNDKKDRIKLYNTIDDKEGILVESMPQIYYNNDYIGGFTEFDNFIKPEYNYNKLKDITKVLTYNLNNVIDYNYYPTPETKKSNLRHRPIGIGVQGLANVFYEMGISFDSDKAKEINKSIFECIYYGALESSVELSKRDGPYETFNGSPASQGILQFDLWNNDNSIPQHNLDLDWNKLKEDIKQHGLRNSLLLAPMPTASTSQILGNYECFEPVMSNIYTRRVLAGEYLVLNNYLVKELMDLEIWNKEIKDELIRFDGSVQSIDVIPDYIKKRYNTAWEIKQKHIIDMSADRGKYICQSQSLNLFIESPSLKVLTSMHFYAWQKGLKTGIYYLRSRPSSKAIQFTLKPKNNIKENPTYEEPCESCSG